MNADATGVLLVDKPAGPTSAAVVDWVRWTMQTGVGHCGTLDPAATGLLVVTLGRATRLATLLSGEDKTYRARFELGRSTTTGDGQGETVASGPVDEAVLERATSIVASWTGTLHLPPPAYSAIKIDGTRAHELARRGEAPALQPRPMTVEAVADVAAMPPRAVEATLRVSKGTYVRSLAEELGRAAGVPTHLSALRREASGRLRLDDPRLVAGLRVTPLPAGRGGKPRVRIRASGAPDDRPGQRALLLRHVIAVRDAAPEPRWLTDVGSDGQRILRALSQGQLVSVEDRGWARRPGADEPMGVVLPAHPGPGLFIAQRSDEAAMVRSMRLVEFPEPDEVAAVRQPRTTPDGREPA